MSIHKLLNCPFCGQQPSLKPSVVGEYTSIVCEGENACDGPLAIVIKNDRITQGVIAWNRRVPEAVAKEICSECGGKREVETGIGMMSCDACGGSGFEQAQVNQAISGEENGHV